MRFNTLGRALAALAAFVGAFVLLVVIQFPSEGPISASVAGVALKAQPSADGEGFRSAELSGAGLRLVFSDKSPLRLIDQAGASREARPVSYEVKSDGILLAFDDGSTLRAAATPTGGLSWSIVPKGKTAEVQFRYELAYGAALAAPTAAVSGADSSLRLSLGSATYRVRGAQVGDTPRTLSVVASRGAIRPFTATPETSDTPAAPAQFIAQAPMDPAAWAKEISAWRDKAWSGLSGTAFDAAAATWAPPQGASSGTPAFDEESFVAFEAEAYRRGSIELAASLVQTVRTSHASSLGWLSAPFAGRTAASMGAWEAAFLTDIKAIEQQVSARSADVFYRRGIVPFLFDRAPYSLAQEAVALARTIDFSKADTTQAAALIRAWLDARNYLADDQNPFGRAVDLVDKALTPQIRKADGSFYLQTGPDGRCDAVAGIELGAALIELAEATDKSIYAGIGQSLIMGFLRLSAPDGSMPASVVVGGGGLVRSPEAIPAARVYGVIGGSPYYPRAVSFYKTLGPGAWAWTCAPAISVESSPETTVYSVDWPVGSSHYMALYGVKPYTKIQLYGLDYNMDASFENYNASGYFYKKSAGAMYLKMRHKARREEIRLFH